MFARVPQIQNDYGKIANLIVTIDDAAHSARIVPVHADAHPQVVTESMWRRLKRSKNWRCRFCVY